MAIVDRTLAAGTRLVATYKKAAYVCLVGQDDEGGLTFTVADRTFRSISSAAMHVMGGKAANGWRFWTVEGTETTTTAPGAAAGAEKAQKADRKRTKLISRLPNQKGVAEGEGRFWCNACMKSFLTTEAEPAACPEGHRADDPELTAPVTVEAGA